MECFKCSNQYLTHKSLLVHLKVFHSLTWQAAYKSTVATDLLQSFNQSTTDEIQPVADFTKPCIEEEMYINIHTILEQTSIGSRILKFYKENNMLNDSMQNLLVDTIINDVVQRNLKMNVSLAKSLASKIVNLFPTETMVRIFIFKIL